MSWYAESYSWIKQQELENPGLSRKELRKHCSKNYPFSARSGYAYKAWLKAMRDVFGRTRPPPATDQSELNFEGNKNG